MGKKEYLVDVPVRVNIWTRTDCQRRQFEVLRQARPSIIFLQSDGGRNEKEWESIKKNRAIFDNEIDWECEVHKIYEEKNLGLYSMAQKVSSYIWKHVDRCIFLEDDHVPAVSFFKFCEVLLERYKDDQRVEMITGNNVFEKYDSTPYDYFFTESGWSIWGVATWRDRALQRNYPLPYSDNEYIKSKLKENLSSFWCDKALRYCKGTLVDGHVPGGEFFHAVNSVLYHRLSIVPSKNMICNIGMIGEHAHVSRRLDRKTNLFNMPVYEIQFPLNHPEYVIDDKDFGKMYHKKLKHSVTSFGLFFNKSMSAIKMLIRGSLLKVIKRKINNSKTES